MRKLLAVLLVLVSLMAASTSLAYADGKPVDYALSVHGGGAKK